MNHFDIKSIKKQKIIIRLSSIEGFEVTVAEGETFYQLGEYLKRFYFDHHGIKIKNISIINVFNKKEPVTNDDIVLHHLDKFIDDKMSFHIDFDSDYHSTLRDKNIELEKKNSILRKSMAIMKNQRNKLAKSVDKHHEDNLKLVKKNVNYEEEIKSYSFLVKNLEKKMKLMRKNYLEFLDNEINKRKSQFEEFKNVLENLEKERKVVENYLIRRRVSE